MEGNCLNLICSTYKNATANIIFNGEIVQISLWDWKLAKDICY